MFNKIITCLFACLFFVGVPVALIRPEALLEPKLGILVFLAFIASVTQPSYSPVDSKAPVEDRGTARQIVWSVYIPVLIGIVESMTLSWPRSMELDVFSICMMFIAIGGLLLRAWAVNVLGRFFTWHVRVQNEQHVITEGPYSVMRHPSYTGALIFYIFLLLFIYAWMGALTPAVLLGYAYYRRISFEEALLVRHFGNQYRDYSKQVKRLIPWIF